MQILTSTGTRLIKFIPREIISGSNTYELTIKSEEKNKVILTDSTASFSSLKYYYTYSTTQALVAANFYILEIKNTTDSTFIFKDKIFCTDQDTATFEISKNVYVEKSTGDNEYVYYG